MGAAALGERWGYAESFRVVFYALIPFCVVAVGLCAALPNVKRFMTDRVLVETRSGKDRMAGRGERLGAE